ncbi:MAG: TIGR04282 family arsenosugar biosynthesis glycosyltransferase, partial [Burkholderiales bacterium]
ILIGADCPALQPRDLRRADRLLRGACDAVLAPAEDGGYALIALKRISPRLFEGIAWGGPEVFRQTVQRLEGLGLRWRALRTVWDVDRPEDLARLRSLRFP